MEEKKKEKKDFYLVESDSETGKRKEKKVLKHQTMLLFCPTCNLHLFHYFLYFILYHYLHHFYYL